VKTHPNEWILAPYIQGDLWLKIAGSKFSLALGADRPIVFDI
jgi:hypothetical protein